MAEQHTRGWHSHIEGMDMAGKTTQLQLAGEYAAANGIPFEIKREPGQTQLGVELRNQILHNRGTMLSARTELLMYMADRSHTIDTETLPLLEAGVTVAHDRGPRSSEAYQGAAGGVSAETVRSLHERIFPSWYINPDAIAVLAISKETYRRRRLEKDDIIGLDKIEERGFDYAYRVIDEFERIAKEHPSATRVDGEMKPDEVFTVIRPLIFGPEHA